MNEGTETIRVLLANDNAVIRAGVREVLERTGDFEVIAEAGDGGEALKLIRELEPDVAVVDVQMHRVYGIEVVREVQYNSWPVAVVVLTSYDDDPNISALLKSGNNGFVLQTASPEDIVDAIWDAYHGKTEVDASALSHVMAQVSRMDICPEITPLTEAEVEILSLVGRGMTNHAIGTRLGINDYTVQWHLIRIFDKLQANNRTEAVTRALSMGVLQGTMPGSSEYVVFQN